MKKRTKIILIVIASLLALLIAGSLIYLLTGRYSAQDKALQALQSDAEVTVNQTDGMISFEGPDTQPDQTKGFIFYPGGKVDEKAYAPLLHELARSGWFCVLLSAPFDIAFFNSNGAQTAIDTYPQVENWYLGGHSLGGVVASGFAKKNESSLQGIVFLASYPSANLSASTIKALSTYGTNDGVMNKESYENNKSNFPAHTLEVPLEGGNHSQFGDYGFQEGDNPATISAEEQIQQTIALINQM